MGKQLKQTCFPLFGCDCANGLWKSFKNLSRSPNHLYDYGYKYGLYMGFFLITVTVCIIRLIII